MSGDLAPAAARARGLLERGGWIDVSSSDGTYALRVSGDRRSRTTMTLTETCFRDLVRSPGLKTRAGGGWIQRAAGARDAGPRAGAPGRIEGQRAVMEADGSMTLRRANMGESPIAWLARRKDAAGQPLLSSTETAAGERLRMDAEIAQSAPSLTMRWDALPRTGGGGASARVEPGDRALAAGRRVARALSTIDARTRSLVEQICIREGSLQLAEREAGLKRRQGKLVLKAGLQTLARHYGIGD